MTTLCLKIHSKSIKVYGDFLFDRISNNFSSFYFPVFLYYKLHVSYNPKNILTLKQQKKYLVAREGM